MNIFMYVYFLKPTPPIATSCDFHNLSFGTGEVPSNSLKYRGRRGEVSRAFVGTNCRGEASRALLVGASYASAGS